MNDASGNSERQLSQSKMAVYMRDRTKAKKLGLTVKQWRDAGRPGDGSPMPEAQSSPVEATGAS